MQKPVFVIGEAFGDEEARKGTPFSGVTGAILRGIMRQVGIPVENCYFTNVFNLRPPGGTIDGLYTGKESAIPGFRPIKAGKYIHARYKPELDRLEHELNTIKPNVVLALGNLALWAICKKTGIKKYRGSPILSHDAKWKVIPTWSPASALKQWEIRAIMLADFSKVAREMTYPELVRPQRFIYMEPSLQDIETFYNQFLKHQPFVSVDVETKGLTITEVGYGTADGKHCLVIPFWDRTKRDGNYWKTLEEEAAAWAWVRRINKELPTIGQNFSYDMQYFWRTVGIPTPRFLGDTMLLHHSLQPELEKGLGFLGSVYTDEPSWKFMRTDHATLKQEDE